MTHSTNSDPNEVADLFALVATEPTGLKQLAESVDQLQAIQAAKLKNGAMTSPA